MIKNITLSILFCMSINCFAAGKYKMSCERLGFLLEEINRGVDIRDQIQVKKCEEKVKSRLGGIIKKHRSKIELMAARKLCKNPKRFETKKIRPEYGANLGMEPREEIKLLKNHGISLVETAYGGTAGFTILYSFSFPVCQ